MSLFNKKYADVFCLAPKFETDPLYMNLPGNLKYVVSMSNYRSNILKFRLTDLK